MASEFKLSFTAAEIDAKLKKIDNMSGSVDWADIENNPFGGKSDTVSWANAGIDVSTAPQDTWVKVSDAVVTVEEIFADGRFMDGVDITFFSENVIYSTAANGQGLPIEGASDNWFIEVADFYYGNNHHIVNFRPDGVYFMKTWGGETALYPLSVTFPGYGKFTSTKPIDIKYLPDSLQLETVGISDTLAVDSILAEDGLVDQSKMATVDGWYWGWRKVSDANIPMESYFRNEWNNIRGYDWGYAQDEIFGYLWLTASLNENDTVYALQQTDENGNTYNFGVYVPNGSDRGLYIDPYMGPMTITANDAVFTIKTPKTIDPKYLPKALPFDKTQGGDAIEWDGNIDGRFTIDNGRFVKVSDVVVTEEDLQSDFLVLTPIDRNEPDVVYSLFKHDGQTLVDQSEIALGAIAIHSYDNYDNLYEAIILVPEGGFYPSGVYFNNNIWGTGVGRVYGLIIPGFNKFHITKIIESDYLPEALQFGEVPGDSDTLLWDGNTHGNYTCISEQEYTDPWGNTSPAGTTCYKVSDNVITAADLVNGATITVCCLWNDEPEYASTDCSFDNGLIQQRDDGSICIVGMDINGNNIYNWNAWIYPENSMYPAGIYFGFSPDYVLGGNTDYVSSLTVPGYSKFPVIKKIDRKYLPDDIGNSNNSPVTSVNGKIGDVQLTASDVGALPDTTQIPTIEGLATKEELAKKPGEIVTGKNYTIDGAIVTADTGAEVFNDYSNNKAVGAFSHAEGEWTVASGLLSHAEGQSTTAYGICSHAEGINCSALGNYAHAEGSGTITEGVASHAEGYLTKATGANSHAEGLAAEATGEQSHAEGGSTASGKNSHAEGSGTTASGEHSHAEGYWTTASEQSSHAEGVNTNATEYASHAEGYWTTASGYFSHAEGSYTIADSRNQHVQGKYNIEDARNKYAHIVGNGDSEDNRSNAHTIDWHGNAWFQGEVKVGGTGQDDSIAKTLATTEYVDNKFANVDTSAGLPTVTTEDNGKILRVVDGAWAAVTLPIYNGEVEDV